MANRHKKAGGGKVKGGISKANVDYGNKDVIKEAEKKKDGGKVTGMKSGGRLDKRARGGRIRKAGGGGTDCTKSPFAPSHVSTNGDA